MKELKSHYRFVLLYFMIFFSQAIAYSLLITFLNALGYQPMERNLFFAADALAGIFIQSFVGYLCDRYRTIKPFLVGGYVLFAVFTKLIYDTTEAVFWLHLFLVMGVSGLMRITSGLADSLTLETDEYCQKNYGTIRCFGSVGWAIGAPVTAKMVISYGYCSLGWGFIVCTAILLVIVSGMKDAQKTGSETVSFTDVKSLVVNKNYLMVVLILFLFFIVDCTQSYAIPDKIFLLDGNEQDIGNYWALAAMLELPLFIIGGRLVRRFTAEKLMVIAGAFYVIRYVLYGLVNSVWGVFLVGALQAVTYPLLMVCSKMMVDRYTPKNLKSSGQLIAMSIYSGASSMISPLLCGTLEQNFGINTMLMVIALVAVIPTIMTLRNSRSHCDIVPLR